MVSCTLLYVLTDPAQTEESLTIYKIIKAENPSIF